jgi:hypothetical protein
MWSERVKRLCVYLVAVGLLLVPVLAVAEDSSDKSVALAYLGEPADEDYSDEPADEDSSDESAPKEMSIMIGFFARHVSQSDDPNENLKMVVFSYNNWVVSRYINTWDDTTYFGGKRFSTKKYAVSSKNRNFYYQANVYAGLLHGYGNNAAINIKGIAPAAFPTIGVGYKSTSLEVAYVPTPEGGVFLSLFKYSF